MILMILGLLIFLGVHSVRIVAPGYRADMIARKGEHRWKMIYSLVSLIGFVLIVIGFGQWRQTAPVLYIGTYWLVHVQMLLMWVAFVLLASANAPAGYIKTAVKHPMLAAAKLWAFGHLLVNGDLASVVLFGSVLAWAVIDRISEKRRLRADETRNPVFVTAKSDVIAIVAGTAIYLLFVWKLHEWLIGVPVIF